MTNETEVEVTRSRLSDFEQMADAQAQCVPCKLCGGSAVITDAGLGAGYYIACENSRTFRESDGCLINERRLGGWAYNVMEWWNRLHRIASRATDTALVEELRALKPHLPEFGFDRFVNVPESLFERILAVLEGKRT